jgi:hypothetical protein
MRIISQNYALQYMYARQDLLCLRLLLFECLSFKLAVITPGAEETVEVDQGNTVVALVLRMVQPVEVTAGKLHAIVPSNRRDIGVELGIQMVERMCLEEKRQESCITNHSVLNAEHTLAEAQTEGSLLRLRLTAGVVEEVFHWVHRQA